jgi:DNA-binding NtrC family response regulator
VARSELVGEVHPVAALAVPAMAPVVEAPSAPDVRAGMTMAEIERAAIVHALQETRGNRRKAAESLGIGERTLYRKLREYNLADG